MPLTKVSPGVADDAFLINAPSSRIRITDYLTAFDTTTDQSAALEQAIIDLFNSEAQTLDLEGQIIPLSSNVKLITGDNLTSSVGVERNRENSIENGKIIWAGGAGSGGKLDDYMFEMGSPAGEGQFSSLTFRRVMFDARGATKNLFKFFQYYNLIFDQCHWNDYDEGVGTWLAGRDNAGNEAQGNGALFLNCRWSDLTTTDGLGGTPLLAYDGDVVIDGGWAEWTGPHDFHKGSVTITAHHWSYGEGGGGGSEPFRVGARFRDPRGITVTDCDFDNAYLLFDPEGIDAYNATILDSWRGLYVAGNKTVGKAVPANNEGLITLRTRASNTSLRHGYFDVGTLTLINVSDNTVPGLRLLTGSGGSWGSITGCTYVYRDQFGLYPSGDQLGAQGSATRCLFLGSDDVASDRFRIKASDAYITGDGDDGLRLASNNTDRWEIIKNGVMRPVDDNTYNLGASSQRIAEIFAANGTINTSDAREKQDIEALTAAEQRVAQAVRGLLRRYRWQSAVATKGDGARYHFGVIAQDVAAAFLAEGLDPWSYGCLTADTLGDGTVRYGVRYNELLALMLAAV